MSKSILVRACAGALLAFSLGSCAAQSYRCQVQGQWVYTDKPCARPVVGAYGPTALPQTVRTSTPAQALAPSYLSLMSGRCAAQHDALRTAATRGLSGHTRTELQRNYERECRPNELDAMQRWRENQQFDHQMAQRQVADQQAERQRSEDRCLQLRDAVFSRSRRPEAASDAQLPKLRELYTEQCERRSSNG